MYQQKRHIAIISLICSCLVMLTTTILPHHHHDDGHICLALGDTSHTHSGHDDDTSACDDSCLMKLGVLREISQIAADSKIALHQIAWVAILYSQLSVPDAGECKTFSSPYIYIEKPCKCVVCTHCGLRAPPATA